MFDGIFSYCFVYDITKFQRCRGDNIFFIVEKPLWKHFDKNNTLKFYDFIKFNICAVRNHMMDLLDE